MGWAVICKGVVVVVGSISFRLRKYRKKDEVNYNIILF